MLINSVAESAATGKQAAMAANQLLGQRLLADLKKMEEQLAEFTKSKSLS